MKLKKKLKVKLVFLLTFIFVLNPIFAFAADLEAKSTETENEKNKISAQKIAPEIKEELEEKDFVEVLVELDQQVDTTKISKNTVGQLKGEATNFQTKMACRYAVVDSLKVTAQETQRDIIKYLEKEKERGNVKEFKSFYIINTIYVKASKKIIDKLSQFEDVKSIQIDEKFEVQRPKKEESSLKTESVDGVTSDYEHDENEEEDKDVNISWGVEKIQAPDVWNTYKIDGTGVVVGVIDSGMDWKHEALKEKWRGYNKDNPGNPNGQGNWFDAVYNEPLPYDERSEPHGTHVTGTILGQDPQGKNVIGVAPGAKWIGAKALTTNNGQLSWMLSAAQWMLAPNGDPSLAPDIINNSWSLGPGKNEWFRTMVQRWRDAGILPVFAAGNTHGGSIPGSVCNPANYPESFAVAATDINNKRGDFSNQGPGPYDEVKPDISAPGVKVRSSVPGGYAEDGWNGTSMAAPHIAGTAALLLSLDAGLTPDQLEAIMINTAKPLTDEQYPQSPNSGYGVGLVNAFDAVTSIGAGVGTIKGRVLQAGTDEKAPEITYEPIAAAYKGADILVEASIKDDVTITKAEILVKNEDDPQWKVLKMNQESGNHKEGVFSGIIPESLIKDPGFKYEIKAYDYGSNVGETPIYEIEVKFGIKPDEYGTDFSEYPLGWKMEGDWQWGMPHEEPKAFDGNKLLGTTLDGAHSNIHSTLTMPPLDLREVEHASIRLNHWYYTEPAGDICVISISDDLGKTWNRVKEFKGFDRTWREIMIDLNPYCGSENPVWVSFTLEADDSLAFKGWYLDNVRFIGNDTEAPGAVSGLKSELDIGKINLTWNKVNDIDLAGYKVYRRTTESAIEFIGNTNNESYSDSDLKGGEKYIYNVKAYDFAGNEGEPSEEVEAVAPKDEIIYASSFEGDNGGWTTGGNRNSWEWGKPITGPKEAYSGEKLWATALNEDYKSDSDCWIETPEIQITTPSAISFKHWYYTETRYDNAYVKISTDNGNNWSDLKEYTGQSYKWLKENIELKDYVGEKIKLRFALTSDGSANKAGWYIDDFVIYSREENSSEEAAISSIKSSKLISLCTEGNIDSKDGYYSNQYKIRTENEENDKGGLPLDAVLTILETGRSVRTNPADGSFVFNHPASKEDKQWTMTIDAYGFYPYVEKIDINKDTEVERDFILKKIPMSRVVGKIVDERTGEPVQGTKVKILEDLRIPTAITDEQGNFTMENVLEGEYTVKISAPNHHVKEVKINVTGEKETVLNSDVKPFIGFDSEIAYDDGVPEEQRARMKAGDGHAVRMTPKEFGLLKGGKFFISDKWPNPEDNKFYAAVFDSKKDGQPGEMIFKTDVIEGVRGDWTYVDLSKFSFASDRDFYLAIIQLDGSPNCPGIAVDTNEPHTERSYKYVDGQFSSLGHETNLLIRAEMIYSLDVPVITNIDDETHTNNDKINISGIVNSKSNIAIYNNGEEQIVVNTEDNKFEAEILLKEGRNEITAKATAGFGQTDLSPAKLVIRDITDPILTLETPTEGQVTEREVVEVIGKVTEEHLSKIIVNGEEIKVDEDGSFKHKVIVVEGENIITVTVEDKAGNKVKEEIKVVAKLNLPNITNINPSSDIIVKAKDKIKVSFNSNEKGGKATFRILIPNTIQSESQNNKVEMKEIETGYYEGIWTVPEQLELQGAEIEFEITNKAGNRSVKTAPGKVYTFDNGLDLNGRYSVKITDVNVREFLDSTLIETAIRNVKKEIQSPMLVVRVTDKDDVVVNISTAEVSELQSGKSIKVSSGFGIEKKGEYKAKVFIWSDLKTMKPLAAPLTVDFTVE